MSRNSFLFEEPYVDPEERTLSGLEADFHKIRRSLGIISMMNVVNDCVTYAKRY